MSKQKRRRHLSFYSAVGAAILSFLRLPPLSLISRRRPFLTLTLTLMTLSTPCRSSSLAPGHRAFVSTICYLLGDERPSRRRPTQQRASGRIAGDEVRRRGGGGDRRRAGISPKAKALRADVKADIAGLSRVDVVMDYLVAVARCGGAAQ